MKGFLLVLFALALGGTACGGYGDGSSPSTEAAVSGSLGPFSASDASALVSGLCDLRSPEVEVGRASTIFFEQVHQRLHVLVAAVEPIDRNVSADLSEAKVKVELDLGGDAFPDSYSDDVASLLRAVSVALNAASLPSPSCG